MKSLRIYRLKILRPCMKSLFVMSANWINLKRNFSYCSVCNKKLSVKTQVKLQRSHHCTYSKNKEDVEDVGTNYISNGNVVLPFQGCDNGRANSGRELPKAIIVNPMIFSLIPKAVAMSVALSTGSSENRSKKIQHY